MKSSEFDYDEGSVIVEFYEVDQGNGLTSRSYMESYLVLRPFNLVDLLASWKHWAKRQDVHENGLTNFLLEKGFVRIAGHVKGLLCSGSLTCNTLNEYSVLELGN